MLERMVRAPLRHLLPRDPAWQSNILPEVETRLLRNEQGARDHDYLWALKEVSFAVKQGEIVGLFGKNGAGKSVLLKILSRVTKPTTGYAEIYGHVGSMLEVGTGFHPKLNGHENIFLSWSILGMRRAEIQQNFDAIVAFSGVENFLFTPVKRYSNGMRVRLAFAIAAHLEPEILLIDEVLSVGDDAFRAKSRRPGGRSFS